MNQLLTKEQLQNLRDRLPWLKRLAERSKRWLLPGFDGVPVYYIVGYFLNELRLDLLVTRAKAIAFTFFLALFPSILFFVSLIPFIPITNVQGNLLEVLQEIVPYSASNLMKTIIADISNKPRGGAISIGLFLALFISSNGMAGMMTQFDDSVRSKDHLKLRSLFGKRMVAINLTLVLFTLLVFSVGLIIMGNKVLIVLLEEFHILTMFNVILFTTLKYLIIFFLFFSSISMIYHYGPSVRKKWDLITPGSTFATMLSIILSIVFSFVINNIISPGRFFGSIGTIIVLQVWIYLNSLALLIGFELNIGIVETRKMLNRKHMDEKAATTGYTKSTEA